MRLSDNYQALFVMPGCKLEVWDHGSGLEVMIILTSLSTISNNHDNHHYDHDNNGHDDYRQHYLQWREGRHQRGEERLQPGRLQEHEGPVSCFALQVLYF